MPAIARASSPAFARFPQTPEWFERIGALWRLLRDVLIEAQAMRHEASRKYPFVDN